MVTPEVVGHIDPVYGRVKTNGEARNRQSDQQCSARRSGLKLSGVFGDVDGVFLED